MATRSVSQVWLGMGGQGIGVGEFLGSIPEGTPRCQFQMRRAEQKVLGLID